MKFHAQCLQSEAIAARKTKALEELQPLMKKAVALPTVEERFLPQFTKPMFRRSFLVLTGPTRSVRLYTLAAYLATRTHWNLIAQASINQICGTSML